MKHLSIGLCLLSLTGTMAFAEGFRDDPKVYLKDKNLIINLSDLVLPTLSFKRDISVPDGRANEDGPLLFQNGEVVALDRVDKSKSYCSLGGSYTDLNSADKETKGEHIFKAGQRLKISGPLTHTNHDVGYTFGKKGKNYTNNKEVSVQMILQGGFGALALNEVYLESGALTKSAFPYDHDDNNIFFGDLKCFKFKKMPTVGEIRKVIGVENFAIMPDETEPMAFEPGVKEFSKFKEDNDGLKVMLKMMGKELMSSFKKRLGVNESTGGKGLGFSERRIETEGNGKASRQ